MSIARRSLLAGLPLAAGLLGKRAEAADAGMSIALSARAVGTLDPTKTVLGADNWACRQIFDTLVVPEDGTFAITPAEFKPSLAQSWDSAADARTWTFHLRQGALWQKDQGEVTSDDVAFSFGRLIDPGINVSNKVLYANIATVEAVDKYTVRFTLKRPDPLFCGSSVYTMSANILPKRAYTERGDAFGQDPVGSGAYATERLELNKGVSLRGFDRHFAGAPIVKQLQVLYMLDTTARTLAFLSGQVDMIEGARTPGWMQSMQQRKPGITFDATKPGSINTLHLNLTRKPLDDLRVRQAIRCAIDSQALARAYGTMGGPMWGISPTDFAGSVSPDSLPPELRYPYDPERAKKLLAEAGFAGGLTIPAFTSQREDYSAIMLMVQEQLRKVGINLALKIIDHTSMQNDNRRDLNSMAMESSSYPPVPTQALLQQLSSSAVVKPDSTGGGNYSHYGVAIPGVDALLEKALDEPDFSRRAALCQEVERQVLRDLPDIGLLTLSYVIARNPRIDVGYPVKSGYAYWPLRRARIVA
jgi:peptide/nickel transport system substrate-binding protein